MADAMSHHPTRRGVGLGRQIRRSLDSGGIAPIRADQAVLALRLGQLLDLDIKRLGCPLAVPLKLAELPSGPRQGPNVGLDAVDVRELLVPFPLEARDLVSGGREGRVVQLGLQPRSTGGHGGNRKQGRGRLCPQQIEPRRRTALA